MLRQSPFDSCLSILQGLKSSANFDHRYNSFFVDYSLVPLLVQQNYIDTARAGVYKSETMSEVAKLQALSQASDACADMEIIGSKIMGGDQHWELLPAQAVMAVRVGALCSGWQAFPAFPQWLGKSSTTVKQKRLTTELVTHTALQVGQGFGAIRMEYVPYLRHRLLAEFTSGSGDGSGAQKCIDMLDSYGLSRDDFMDNLKELQFISPEPRPGPMDLRDNYDGLESKAKAAFTRLYNSSSHTSQALVSQQAVTGKSRKKTGIDNDDDGNAGTTEDLAASRVADNEEEEEDIIDLKAFAAQKQKKPTKTPAKSKAKK